MPTLAGRPKEGGGHQPFNISIEKSIYRQFQKVKNKSKFIEDTIRPILNQMDPGPACNVINRIDQVLKEEIIDAAKARDFEKATALSHVGTKLDEFRGLCRLPESTRSTNIENRSSIRIGGNLRSLAKAALENRPLVKKILIKRTPILASRFWP